MFKLEKVFQNDDTGYYFFINIIKSFVLIVSIYIFSILEKNSIHELLNFQLFINSKYYLYSILVPSFYFILSFFFKKKEYKKNLKSFIENDIYNIVIIHILIFFIFFIFNINFQINNSTFYLFLYLIIILILSKLYFNYLYDRLIEDNIIQKNIMVVGSYNEIKKILNEKFDNIVIFKCCLITDFNNQNLRLIKSEFKFPIFNQNEDIRSILEYHSLGQIWVINAEDKEKEKIFNKIIQFSVDTLNIKLENSDQSTNKKLLFNKFEYEFYEYSKFFGVNLFIKILIDKILAFIFLIIATPILIISGVAIYLEDGFPIIFTQNRTGWDGRRFKVYKLRSLFNEKYNVTSQITKDDNRKLRIGKFIRKYSIDELPQLYNVLKGEMSLVGPRPHPVMLDLQYSNIYKTFLTRYRCNPGLTGWAQVNGLRGATPNPESMKRRMEFDLWYLNNWSIVLDIYIILKTFYAIIKYKGRIIHCIYRLLQITYKKTSGCIMTKSSIELKFKINQFRSHFLGKSEVFIFEENNFDIALSKIFNTFSYIFLPTIKICKKILMKILDKILEFGNQQNDLKKRILKQDEILNNNLKLNAALSEQISQLNNKIDNLSSKNDNSEGLEKDKLLNINNPKTSNIEIDFYQKKI